MHALNLRKRLCGPSQSWDFFPGSIVVDTYCLFQGMAGAAFSTVLCPRSLAPRNGKSMLLPWMYVSFLLLYCSLSSLGSPIKESPRPQICSCVPSQWILFWKIASGPICWESQWRGSRSPNACVLKVLLECTAFKVLLEYTAFLPFLALLRQHEQHHHRVFWIPSFPLHCTAHRHRHRHTQSQRNVSRTFCLVALYSDALMLYQTVP